MRIQKREAAGERKGGTRLEEVRHGGYSVVSGVWGKGNFV